MPPIGFRFASKPFDDPVCVSVVGTSGRLQTSRKRQSVYDFIPYV